MKAAITTTPIGGSPFQSRRRPLVIKKFGGTSVANIERIRRIARLALEAQRAGNDVVVVVSAMGGETDRLLKLAYQLLPVPDSREMDVLAATGEQVTVALTALAIQAEGGKAASFLGHQLPVITDSSFTRARIQCVEQGPIREALAGGQIAVVAGFQGVDPKNNITTLGRGGSDTTAVAVAATLGADICEIYTDVEGVFTADPRVCPSGLKLKSIPYEEMLELASLGAKVLQVRSVEIAMKYDVPIHVRSSFTEEEGTRIVSRDKMLESRRLMGLACERNQVRVELIGAECRPGLVAELTDFMAELNVSVDMLCHSRGALENPRADISFTLPEGELRRAQPELEHFMGRLGASSMQVSSDLAKVSLVGIGLRSDPGIAARLCRSLTEQGIHVSGLSVNELRISCLVEGDAADQAVCILHETFELAGETRVEPLASLSPA
ncbi:aspartate kinase [Stigmatella aurantiaca]|uniref:Aspartokinase n=1 Tax=Stigmatella aurantiaca (strain DW4/3-1) TaxID=378806 RepID=Q08U33_STIAD|nr:aspartate kinase [Stigmatella aurantiaca]ADO73858.1 Aspartokinase [Stigmatella aurantiaca DW4/3-1]EAU64003.1 aspartokinase (Aspartate kinase) [Stigmatella aurantiaca DW4/3-1]